METGLIESADHTTVMLRNPLHVYGESCVDVPAHLNFGEYLIRKIWEHGKKPAWVDVATDDVITFQEMAQQGMNIAVSLTHLGVRKGDVVAICSENRNEYWSVVIGATCAGAVLTGVNPAYTSTELNHVLSITKPKFMFCSPSFYSKKENTLKKLTYLKKIILFGDERKTRLLYKDLAIANGNDSKNVFEDNKLRRNIKFEEFESVGVEGQTDVVFILYSSGTTGMPKGVMLTHLNILTVCCGPSTVDTDKPSLYINPWFHVMGLVGGLFSSCVGRTVVYLPKFDVDLYLKTIEKYKIEYLYVVPPVLVAACKSTASYDVSSVLAIASGAAPLQSDTISIVKKKFPNVLAVIQGYGMTEVTLGIIRGSIDDIGKPGSVGKVVAGHVVKVVDVETQKPLGPNQSGELRFKGGLVMKGYVGKNNKDYFDDEGFFKSGDIGYYDEDRTFFIVDRLKELIKYKAYQVAPAEVEALLLQHEEIRDAAVVGLPDHAAGELPLAFVVKQPGSNVTEKEIQDFVAERLSNPKRLRGGVRFVTEIPKNPSGKIIRKELKGLIKRTSKL